MTFYPKYSSSFKALSNQDSCCLPPRASLKARVFQVAFMQNTSNTYYSDWIITNDFENFRARSDVLNTNAGSNSSVYSYKSEVDGLTYNYVHMWNENQCFCTKTSRADWKKGFCTPPGKLLEESNIAMRMARKYGTEKKETNANYSGAYTWTQSVDGEKNEYCWFIGDYVFEVNVYGTVSKTTQFYDMSLQVDEKAFEIPKTCPPPASCRLV